MLLCKRVSHRISASLFAFFVFVYFSSLFLLRVTEHYNIFLDFEIALQLSFISQFFPKHVLLGKISSEQLIFWAFAGVYGFNVCVCNLVCENNFNWIYFVFHINE